MSVELGKETVRVSQVINENSTQTVVENDIIVPDIKPDIANILVLDGDIVVSHADCKHDKVVITGTINYKILYSTDEEKKRVTSINTQSDFSYSMDLFNVREGMSCFADCSIEYMDYNILGGRKINLKTIVNINVRAQSDENINIVNSIYNLEDVQILKDNIDVNVYLGEAQTDFTVNELIEIPSGKPSIKEILFVDMKVAGATYKVSDEKIVSEGQLAIKTIYAADDEDENIQLVEYELPFTQFIDLPGALENTHCNIKYRILESGYEAVEDSDGELRVINLESAINIRAEGFINQTFEIVKDAYSPRNMLSLERSVFRNENILAKDNKPADIKEIILLDESQPDINEVFSVLCKPVLSGYKVENNVVIVEGVTVNNIIYTSNDEEQTVCSYKEELPFTQTFDINNADPDAICKVNLDLQHSSYNIVSRNEIELRLVINVEVEVLGYKEIHLVDTVEENPVDEDVLINQPSIVIYFAQPDDTLWDIAKRYYTTMSAIKTINNMEADNIYPGQQIFIPKRVS